LTLHFQTTPCRFSKNKKSDSGPKRHEAWTVGYNCEIYSFVKSIKNKDEKQFLKGFTLISNSTQETAMLVCNPYEVVIHGTTNKGKIFRPSDWAERLCGILSSFTKDNRLSYSNWVRPMLVDNVRCVAVDKKLEEDNPQMFRFLMDFAADNDLRIIDCKELLKEQEDKAQGEPAERVLLAQAIEEKHAAEKAQAETVATEYILREIPPEDTSTAFAALSVLRSALTDISKFTEQINTIQRPAGIDDIVTLPQSRRKGYASRLLAEVSKIGAETGVTKIHLNVHVNHDRVDAHRLYFKNGFEICAYHFRCDPK